MGKSSIISILITFCTGIIFGLIPTTFDNKPSNILDLIVYLVKSGLISLILISTIPLIISFIIMFRNKKFPNGTFTKTNYIFLIIITVLAFMGLF